MDHLTSAQIEEYVAQDHTRASDGLFQSLEAHLEDCESCLDRVLHAHRMHLGLLEGDRMNTTRHPGCPEETALQELAAGICPPETAGATAQHASRCDFCGPLLSRYLKEFSDDLSPEDAAILKELESSKPGWQRKFIREQVGSGQDKRERSFFGRFWPALAAATAALAVTAAVVLPTLMSSDLKKAQQLVADAYGEKRTIEMRLTSVPYAPYEPRSIQLRGGDNSSLMSQRPTLLRAGAAVGDKLRSGGNTDPHWLQVEGRVTLLEADPNSANAAQQILEKAKSQGLTDPSLEIDLAASDFEARRADDKPDLSHTINLLTAALDDLKISNQQRLVALFDLGVAYQKAQMLDLAIKTWEQYLKLDPSSDWAAEARQRLDDARKALPLPQTQGRLDPQSPFFF
jgi:hypothetical protein